VITTDEVNLEDYESVLVKVLEAVCVADLNGYNEWTVNDGSGDCLVDDYLYFYDPEVGHYYDVTGVVNYYYDMKILPRFDTDVYDHGIDVEENDLRTPLDLTVAPNVTSGAFNVRLSVPAKVDGNVSLYDASGRVVTTFVRGDITEGLHTYTFNGDLQNGVYFVKADLSSRSLVKTVVLMK
jgi:hypothetical protein